MSDVSQGPGWWQASDGRWYPPEQAPGAQLPPPAPQAGPHGQPYGQGQGQPYGQGQGQPYGQPYGQGYAGYSGHGTAVHGAPGGYGTAAWPLATWGERVIATLIDGAISFVVTLAVVIVGSILMAASTALGTLVLVVGYLGAIAFGIYIAYMNGAVGQSPGKKLTGIKVIGEHSGQPIGGGMGIVRAIAHTVDGLVCYIGYLLPLWDDKRQTIADKIMKTVVVSGLPKQQFGEIFKT